MELSRKARWLSLAERVECGSVAFSPLSRSSASASRATACSSSSFIRSLLVAIGSSLLVVGVEGVM